MGFTLNPYLIARFGIREFFKVPVGDSIGTETSNVIFSGLPFLAKSPYQGNSPILTSHRRMSIFTYHLFSLFTCQNFFSVPVGDSKGTKTSNFPLTSVPSIDIKTLGGRSPILAKDKN